MGRGGGEGGGLGGCHAGLLLQTRVFGTSERKKADYHFDDSPNHPQPTR